MIASPLAASRSSTRLRLRASSVAVMVFIFNSLEMRRIRYSLILLISDLRVNPEQFNSPASPLAAYCLCGSGRTMYREVQVCATLGSPDGGGGRVPGATRPRFLKTHRGECRRSYEIHRGEADFCSCKICISAIQAPLPACPFAAIAAHPWRASPLLISPYPNPREEASAGSLRTTSCARPANRNGSACCLFFERVFDAQPADFTAILQVLAV